MSFYKIFHDVMIKHFEARTHWGKKYYLSASDVKKSYEVRSEKFINDLRELDPNQMLFSSFIEDMFVNVPVEKKLFDIDYYHLTKDRTKQIYEEAVSAQPQRGFYKMLLLKGSSEHQLRKSYGRFFGDDYLIPFLTYENRFEPSHGSCVRFKKCEQGKIKYLYKGDTYSEVYKQVDRVHILCKIKVNHDKFFVLFYRY